MSKSQNNFFSTLVSVYKTAIQVYLRKKIEQKIKQMSKIGHMNR